MPQLCFEPRPIHVYASVSKQPRQYSWLGLNTPNRSIVPAFSPFAKKCSHWFRDSQAALPLILALHRTGWPSNWLFLLLLHFRRQSRPFVQFIFTFLFSFLIQLYHFFAFFWYVVETHTTRHHAIPRNHHGTASLPRATQLTNLQAIMQQRNHQSQWRPSWNHQRTLASKPPLQAALAKARSKHHHNRETPPQGLDEASHQSHRDEEEVLAPRLGCCREPYGGDALKACKTSPLCNHEQDRRASTIDDERDGSSAPSWVTWLVEWIEGIDIAMAESIFNCFF